MHDPSTSRRERTGYALHRALAWPGWNSTPGLEPARPQCWWLRVTRARVGSSSCSLPIWPQRAPPHARSSYGREHLKCNLPMMFLGASGSDIGCTTV